MGNVNTGGIMAGYRDRVMETVCFLKKYFTAIPEVGILTGTGLSKTVDFLGVNVAFDYSKIPNFPISTVESHRGRLLSGTLAGRNIIAMQGRFHLYEGYSPLEVTFPVMVMKELGVRYLFITNASGGINLDFSEGDIMVIRDHINLTGSNPLVGQSMDSWGERFPDMVEAYDPGLAKLAEKSAMASGLSLKSGVYAGLLGPSLETPAETRFLKIVGSDAVGFSTVLETIAGVHAGMKVLGLSVITNINDPDNPQKASVAAIIKTAEEVVPKLDMILKGVVELLP